MLWIVCKIGYCAEFNTNGALIQENYGADCRKYDPPCPKIYNSAEAYKCELISYPYIRLNNHFIKSILFSISI